MNQHSLDRLNQVHPELAEKIRQMADILSKENIDFEVTQGLRTWEEQDALYQQGRTTPGNIVTKAKAGYSWHNFGLAVDVCPVDQMPPQLDWDLSHPQWKRLVEVGESLGLVSGSEWKTFKDWPHFQLTGNLPMNAPDDNTRQTYLASGLDGVWSLTGLDQTGEVDA